MNQYIDIPTPYDNLFAGEVKPVLRNARSVSTEELSSLLIIMSVMKARWNELGFGRGYRVWVVIGASCLVPVGVLVVQVITGRAVGNVLYKAGGAFLTAGFPEEVFFRGILLTRLIRVVGTKWGIVLAALLFGLLHFALNLNVSGDTAETLAKLILSQAVLGITVSVLFLRTRNIWVGVVFHTLLDATGL